MIDKTKIKNNKNIKCRDDHTADICCSSAVCNSEAVSAHIYKTQKDLKLTMCSDDKLLPAVFQTMVFLDFIFFTFLNI